MKTLTVRILILGCVASFGAGPSVTAEEDTLPVAKSDRKTAVDFEKEILPLFRKN